MQRTASIVSLLVLAGSASAQSIISLGVLPGGSYSRASGISADGTVVVGTSNSGTTERAFRWTAATGMVNLGLMPGGTFSQGRSVSPNGAVVVGFAGTPAGGRAFRWTAGGGFQDLGALPGAMSSVANGVSADQSAVVGFTETPSGNRAFRWTLGAGMVDLGTLPGTGSTLAEAVSSDGDTVVGGSGGLPFVWTPSQGIRQLPAIAGGWSGSGRADGVSADGTAICGSTNWRSFLWTADGGTRLLGEPAGKGQTLARAISGDGRTVGGSSYNVFVDQSAFIWRASTGSVELETYLDIVGIAAFGWELSTVSGISADGTAITGTGRFLGQDRAFLITGLPRPCRVDMNGDGVLNIFDFLAFQNAFDAGSDRADINGDGVLNIFDFLEFQNMFDAGCP